MDEPVERFTYRQLADRLGITPDAARMKAKRESAKGRWLLIAGNHPQDPVHIDVPLADLPATPPAPRSPPSDPTTPDAAPVEAVLGPLLEAAIARADTLAERLLTEGLEHGETRTAYALALQRIAELEQQMTNAFAVRWRARPTWMDRQAAQRQKRKRP